MARVFGIPMAVRFRGITVREGVARLEAVRDALGPEGFVRVDANGLWDVDTALAGVLPELDHACGLGTLSLLESDLVSGSLRPLDDHLPVPAAPPEPGPELLDTYALNEPERVTWWTDRLQRAHRLLIEN